MVGAQVAQHLLGPGAMHDRDDRRAHRLGDQNRRHANAAGGAENADDLARRGLCAQFQGEQRGLEVDTHRGALVERELVGQSQQLFWCRGDLFGEPADDRRDQDAVARAESGVRGRLAHHACDLGPRGVRHGSPQLIFALAHQEVGETYATRLDVDEYLARAGCRIVDLGQLQTVWSGLCGEHLCFHAANPTRSERSHG